MDRPVQATAIFSCACGQVVVEALGAPITSVVCYCDDCQEGARQIQSLPRAGAVQGPDGGTGYLAYRKDRISHPKGESLLGHHKLRETSKTYRAIATCCNTAMYLGFDDGKHWVDLYRSRCPQEVMPVQMRICTRFKADGVSIPTDVPQHSRYPASLLLKLLSAKAAMLLRR